ncbi:MAG: exopolysaccharide biosynthesis polyprenyl glycosylphosphotransferase [Patescibacteria group bacterium]
MSGAFVKIKQWILLSGDFLSLYLALFLSLMVRYKQDFAAEMWNAHLTPFTIIYLVWILVFYINGLYDLRRAKNNLEFSRLFFSGLAINALIAIGFFYLAPWIGIAPKTNLFLVLLFVIVLIYGWRMLFNFLIVRSFAKTRILFLGEANEFEDTIKFIRREPQLGYETAEIITPTGGMDLKKIIEEKKASIVVLGGHIMKSPELTHSLYEAIFSQVTFVDSVTFFENLTGQIPVAVLNESWFLENLKEADKKLYNLFKIIADFILALILGALLLALLPLIAVAIKLQDRGAIFYSQHRVGSAGRKYTIYKLRTMVQNAEGAGAQFAGMNDARITPVGQFLRKTRLDELPQIWNVLRGEMSFIGPRPERPEFVAELTRQMPFYAVRHLIKPGLTGWAQINYPYAGTLEENLKKLEYDLYYIKNRSLLLDITILFKTLNIILRFKGR